MTDNQEKAYFVVEFRLPIYIADSDTPEDAALKASKIVEKEYGFYPSAWYARVFEYGDIESGIGVVAEYFSNPSGTKFRKVDQNIARHEEIISKEENGSE